MLKAQHSENEHHGIRAHHFMGNRWENSGNNVRLDELQARIKIDKRNINNLRYADDTTLMAEQRGVKILLMSLKEEGKRAGLRLHIKKTKILASSPICPHSVTRLC